MGWGVGKGPQNHDNRRQIKNDDNRNFGVEIMLDSIP